MIRVLGRRSHISIFGRNEILQFIDWLEDEVYKVKYRVDHKLTTSATANEVEESLEKLNDVKRQIYMFATFNTVEYGEAIAEFAGIELLIRN